MLQVGDKVTSRKIGPVMVGQVHGLMKATLVCHQTNGGVSPRSNHWEQLYPNWFDGNLAYVVPDVPVRPITYQEFLQQHNCEHSQTTRDMYLYQVGLSNILIYPIEDLEVME